MDLVYTVVLPIVAIAFFGTLGFLRGAFREAFVSGALAVAALMSEVWGNRWGPDLASFVSGLNAGDAAFYVTLAMLVLTVLVIGYGLGSSLVRGAPSRSSRTLGLILGILNGGAFAGWLLRSAFVQLDGSDAASPVYQNGFARAMMIWAGWYPVALAAVGAVVALLRAFATEERVEVKTSTTTTVSGPPAPTPASGYQTPYAGGSGGYGGVATSAWQPPQRAPQPPPQAPNPYPPISAYVPAAPSYPPPPAVRDADPVPPQVTTVTIAPSAGVMDSIRSEPTVSHTEATGVGATHGGAAIYHTPPLGMPVVASGTPSTDNPGAAQAERHEAATAAVPLVRPTSPDPSRSESRKCRTCGSALAINQIFCTECGTRVES